MTERVEILIDVQHIKKIIKTIICPVEYCTEDHKIARTNQYVTHAAVALWLDNLFAIGNEAFKRAASSSVMDNRNLVLEADIKAAMKTFYFDPKIPFVMEETEAWGTEEMNPSEQW